MTELSESALGRSVFAKIMEVEFGIKLHAGSIPVRSDF